MPRRSPSFDAVLHIPAMRQALLEVCIGGVDELSERTALLGGLRTKGVSLTFCEDAMMDTELFLEFEACVAKTAWVAQAATMSRAWRAFDAVSASEICMSRIPPRTAAVVAARRLSRASVAGGGHPAPEPKILIRNPSPNLARATQDLACVSPGAAGQTETERERRSFHLRGERRTESSRYTDAPPRHSGAAATVSLAFSAAKLRSMDCCRNWRPVSAAYLPPAPPITVLWHAWLKYAME